MDDVEGLIGRLRAEAQAAADGAKMLGMLSAPASKKAAASYVGLAALYDEAASALTRLHAIEGEREAWEWLARDKTLSVEWYAPVYGDDGDDAEEWRVHRESGNINDREWDVVGAGPTPLAAVQTARSLLSKVSSYG